MESEWKQFKHSYLGDKETAEKEDPKEGVKELERMSEALGAGIEKLLDDPKVKKEDLENLLRQAKTIEIVLESLPDTLPRRRFLTLTGNISALLVYGLVIFKSVEHMMQFGPLSYAITPGAIIGVAAGAIPAFITKSVEVAAQHLISGEGPYQDSVCDLAYGLVGAKDNLQTLTTNHLRSEGANYNDKGQLIVTEKQIADAKHEMAEALKQRESEKKWAKS